MKNTLTLIIIVLTASFAKAQFKLTSNGFVNATDTTKNYVVLNIEGKSKADLFKSTLVYLNKLYPNPTKNISSVEGETISVFGIDDTAIGSVFNEYTFNFEFKDNKIKINSPTYKLYWYPNGDLSNYEIYSAKGKLKRDKDRDKLVSFYNGFSELIKANAEKKNENW